MAVTVTDNRTTQYQDGLTGITGASTEVTNFFAEETSCAGNAYNIATGQIYYGSSLDTTATGNELLYVWSAIVATQNGYKEATPADSSHASYIGDGTNNFIAYQAGNDRDAFKHAENQVGFQCFLVDMDYLTTMNTNGDIAFLDGSLASLNEASITRIGAHYTTLSKALGGGQNCYVDIIRSGGRDDGLQITGGTTGDRGTFVEICVEDRSTANGKAHGIIREYTGGAYGVQGTLRIGDNATGTSYFEDSGFSVTFEDRYVADDKYALYFDGNGTGTVVVRLSNGTIASARPAVLLDFSSAGINDLLLDGVTFINTINPLTLPSDTNGTTLVHEVRNCVFNNVGQITPATVVFEDNTIRNSADSANGALLLNSTSNDANYARISFVSGGTGHAIVIESIGTYDLDNFTYSGYGADNTTDAVIYNNSGGAVTINVNGGDTPTVRNGSGASTTVNASVGVTITVQEQDGTKIQNAKVFLELVSNGTDVIPYGITNASGQVTTTFGGTTPADVTGFVAKGTSSPVYKRANINDTITSSGLNATITLVSDE